MMTPAERSKLVGVLGMLGSDHDGERASAGLLASRILKAAGLTWDQLIAPPPPAFCRPACHATGREAAMAACRRHRDYLIAWEAKFVTSIVGRATLTPRQLATLRKIADELPGRAAA